MVAISVACGLAGAFGAVVFRLLIRFVQALFFEGGPGLATLAEEGLLAEAGDPLAVARQLSPGWRLLLPAIGGLLAGPLVYYLAREARGHGVPEVMKAVALRGGVIRARVVVVKTLASALSIGSGGSVGREGPIVQIGSAVASGMGQLLRLPARQMRTVVGCGAAAGISATFNAPIAGALFAAEVIVGDFAVAQFSPIVISSVVATVVSRFFLGNHPAFPVPPYEIVSPFELAPYMVAGVAAGLVGVAFIHTLSASETLFERLRFPEALKAGLGGLAVGAIGMFLPEVFGVGYTTISAALQGSLSAGLLLALLGTKLLATSLTIGSGGSGGIFAPSLFLGAMTGGVLGTFVHQWFPDATASSGAYALVTMGAVVAATTHAPISAILIIFELTQTIDIIPALMAACVLSTLVSQLLSRESIYTMKLSRQGFDIFRRDDPNPLKNLFVRDVVDDEPEVIPESASFERILDLVVQSSHTQFFVLSNDGRLLGAIALSELRRLLYEGEALRHLVVARDLVDPNRSTVTEDDDLDLVMHLLSNSDVDELAVVDSEEPLRLVGAVHQKDVIDARNAEMLRRDLAGGVSTGVSAVHHGQSIDLGGGFLLTEVVVPSRAVGKTLRELDLRARTGVQVLMIREAARASAVRVPIADDLLAEGAHLVVAGTVEALESLDRLG
ncbi:MAG: chloride channel protein [Myxococcota bacterium]